MSEYLLEMKGISKSFPGVKVLQEVDFTLKAGELHALMGENGAGKSTLMKILCGIHKRESGTVSVKGKPVEIHSTKEAEALGISIIHQELNLIPYLTVMENIFLGREFTFGRTKLINWKRMRKAAQRYLDQLGLSIDPDTMVEELSVGQQQMIEIAKALSMNSEILVLDEPTAALTDREIEKLFEVIASLKQKGVGMVYISHRMEEIFQVSERISVLRDGKYIGTVLTPETNLDELVRMMVGRDIKDRFPKIDIELGEERLRVEGLSKGEKLGDISFTVKAGEILGIAGLMGAGRTEVAKLLFGADQLSKGKIWIDGVETRIRKPIDAISAGIVLVTEDRKHEGLILSLSIRENLSLPNLAKLSSRGFMKEAREKDLSDESIKKLHIRTPHAEQEVGALSGGNQQKVVIGKWMAAEPKILIMDEPTRGVDIGAKKEIYDLMNQLAESGVAIIMISSEMPEVLGMSDRILVMHEGRVTAEFTRTEATQEKIMHAATGGEFSHAG